MTNDEPKTTDDLHRKLHAIQQELRAPKDLTNEFGGFAYRSAEEILSRVKPLLGRLGCVILITDEMTQVGDRFYCRAKACISDGRDRLACCGWAREPLSKKGMDESQLTGSTSSYARKYALCGLLAIDDSKQDPDGAPPQDKTERIDHVMAATLQGLMDETTTDEGRFFEHFKVPRLHELTVAQYERAHKMLLAKKATTHG